jgi:hypothetical protein
MRLRGRFSLGRSEASPTIERGLRSDDWRQPKGLMAGIVGFGKGLGVPAISLLILVTTVSGNQPAPAHHWDHFCRVVSPQ